MASSLRVALYWAEELFPEYLERGKRITIILFAPILSVLIVYFIGTGQMVLANVVLAIGFSLLIIAYGVYQWEFGIGKVFRVIYND